MLYMIYHLHLLTHDKWMKRTALAICILPATFFIIFALGETIGGDMTGFVHIAQLAILATLSYIAYRYPYVGGLLMLFSGLLLAMSYVSATRHFPPITILIVTMTVFIPLIVAGVLFISYARGHRTEV